MINYSAGIYRILNTTNGMVYIGRATNFTSRFSLHKRQLRNGTHANKKMLRDWNQYGESSFVFEVVEYVHSDELERLYELESYWLGKFPKNYNVDKIPHSGEIGKDQIRVVIAKCSSPRYWYCKNVGKSYLVINEIVAGRYKIVGTSKYLDVKDVAWAN